MYIWNSEIGQNVGKLMERAWQEREQKMQERQTLWSRLDHTEKELHDVTTQMKEKICSIVEDVERRVSVKDHLKKSQKYYFSLHV